MVIVKPIQFVKPHRMLIVYDDTVFLKQEENCNVELHKKYVKIYKIVVIYKNLVQYTYDVHGERKEIHAK